MERAGLDYTVDCPPLPGPVHVDRESWEKVVLNLLSNALKFTLDGRVAVALRADGDDAVELTVADTGAGIAAEELPRLFERFHRIAGARARSTEGSGIGLAMTRELVTLHGGTITAASTAGAGTTFTVRIPTGTAHLAPDRVADTASGGAPTATSEAFVGEALRWLPGPAPAPAPVVEEGADAPVSAGRILVADDNADMREYLQRLLADRYEVQLVEDGKSALTAARERPPDLVVTDIMMPVLDGMELLAALRGDRRTAGVPVLLLSARAGEEAAIEGLGAGADDYLVKPFSAAELVARVNAHLKLGRVRRDAEARFTAMPIWPRP
ncbi:ATP-binding protein [Pseudonocardia alni]